MPIKAIILRRELINLLCYTILWENVKMKPGNAFFEPNIAREEMGVRLNYLSCLFRVQPGDSEVSCLTETVGGEIHTCLFPNHLASIASQPALLLLGSVTPHRSLENVATDYKKAVKEVGIEKLPGFLAPLRIGVVADQFVYVEEGADCCKYLLSCHWNIG